MIGRNSPFLINMRAARKRGYPRLKSKMAAEHCCVPECTGDKRRNPELSFHRIPSDPKKRKEWIVKIRRDPGPDFKITSKTYVCSRHFSGSDFRATFNRKTLKSDAVPTIFPWSVPHNQRRELVRLSSSDAVSSTHRTDLNAYSNQELDSINHDENEISLVSEETLQVEDLVKKIERLEVKIKESESKVKDIEQKLVLQKFGLERFSTDDKSIQHYTGFPNHKYFYAFFNFIKPSASKMKSPYYVPVANQLSLAGRPRSLKLIDELFLFLCRLRCGLTEYDLSIRFDIHVTTVSRRLIAWVNFLYFVLGCIPIWLSTDQIKKLMPLCFKEKYSDTKVIIDCTEIKVQTPSSLVLKSQFYSSYKSANTFKALVGIAPHGAVTFISNLYTGSISDVAITKLSGILDLLEPGDDVMADKGFTIKKALAEKRVTLNIPPFLCSKMGFTPTEIEETENIARVRVHVERAIKRIREDSFWEKPVPLSLAGSVNQFWTVSCILSNFRGPLIA